MHLAGWGSFHLTGGVHFFGYGSRGYHMLARSFSETTQRPVGNVRANDRKEVIQGDRRNAHENVERRTITENMGFLGGSEEGGTVV